MTNQHRDALIEVVYTALRVVAAWVYMQHGAQKLLGLLGGFGGAGGTVHYPSLLWFAGIIECTTGPLIMIGLAARAAAFIASGEMAAAYFIQHAPHGFLWTLLNHGETPAILAFLFLYVALRGAGPYSLDAALGRSRKR